MYLKNNVPQRALWLRANTQKLAGKVILVERLLTILSAAADLLQPLR